GAIAVISDGYWRRHFAASPDALGVSIRYGTHNLTIAGIAPPRFHGVIVDASIDIWAPLEQVLSPSDPTFTRGRLVQILARVPEGAQPARFAAEASSILGRSLNAEPGGNGFSRLRGKFSRPLLVLEFVAALVLLIACANLANLMLAGA